MGKLAAVGYMDFFVLNVRAVPGTGLAMVSVIYLYINMCVCVLYVYVCMYVCVCVCYVCMYVYVYV
jgi:hypothetical protein